VTDAPVPRPEHANSINADVSGRVIQARDITIQYGPRRLSAFNPRFLATKLTGMSVPDGVEMLADADNPTAAAILTDLLSMDEHKAVALLTHVSRAMAENVIKAMVAAPDWLTDLPAAVEAIQATERRNRKELGAAVDSIERAEIPDTGRTGFHSGFEYGHIYWMRPAGAWHTTGRIGGYHAENFTRLGFPLGPPDSKELRIGLVECCSQPFESGTVYDVRGLGTWTVGGSIAECYDKAGGPTGPLGAPISEQVTIESATGTATVRQDFTGGAIFDTGFGSIPVTSAILAYWQECGQDDEIGPPMEPKFRVSSPHGTSGVGQHFERLVTIYSSAKGSFAVSGYVKRLHDELDAVRGWLGFPIAPRTAPGPGRSVQAFEGGGIFYGHEHGPVAVSSAVAKLFNLPDVDMDAVRKLGMPIAPEKSIVPNSGERMQYFQLGVAIVRDGEARAWSGAPSSPPDVVPVVGLPRHGSLAAVSHRDGYQDLFVVTTDHRLMHRRNLLLPPFGEGRSMWCPWRSMDAPAPVHAVTCTSARDGALTVFAMTADGGLMCRPYPDESGHWADWQVLATPGNLAYLAGTCADDDESLVVLTRGGDPAIRRFNGDWLSWNDTPGITFMTWAQALLNRFELSWPTAGWPGGKCVSIAVREPNGDSPIFVARADGSVYALGLSGTSRWQLVSS
jgi:hypothetical protein